MNGNQCPTYLFYLGRCSSGLKDLKLLVLRGGLGNASLSLVLLVGLVGLGKEGSGVGKSDLSQGTVLDSQLSVLRERGDGGLVSDLRRNSGRESGNSGDSKHCVCSGWLGVGWWVVFGRCDLRV